MQPNYQSFADYAPLERGSGRYFTTPNYLSPSSFRVLIPRLPKITYFVQTCSVPSLNIGSMDLTYKGFPRMTHPSSLDLSDQLVINFIVDEDMENWREMYDWMHSIVPSSENEGGITANDIYSDIILLVFNSAKKLKKKLTFHRCYPVSLMSFEFNSGVNEIDPMLVAANFSFKTMEIESY